MLLLLLVMAPVLSSAQSLRSATQILVQRTRANRTNFYVYQDIDSGFNHGFPSGFFASPGNLATIHLDAGCIDDPAAANGCSTDPNRLDREHGTILRITFDPQTAGNFAGVNFEEPENYSANPRGQGYDLRGATQVLFDVRTPTPGGMDVQFGAGGRRSNFVHLDASASYTTLSLSLSGLGLTSQELADAHVLFSVVVNDIHTSQGGTLLLDNIRYDPAPLSQQNALSFPAGSQTFGVLPQSQPGGGRNPFPSDQVLRSLTTIYESAMTELMLLQGGTAGGRGEAREIADAFDYALHHENQADPLPVAADGSVGLHNAYSDGDLALHNDQGPGQGLQGQARLAGFSCGVSATGFCLVFDGATGGNNALAMLALIAAYRQFHDVRYLDDARILGRWIAGTLTDTSGTGYGGYYLGFPDDGVPPPKPLQQAKSIENNADIFAAFTALAEVERALGNPAAADLSTQRANVAGDFVIAMFDAQKGRFYAGTLPVGQAPGPGLDPSGPQRGNDIINRYDFIDSNTFVTLALAGSPRYTAAIDWRRPIQYVLDNFAVTVTNAGVTLQGFNIVTAPTAGPNGIAWEFTGQVVETLHFVDRLYREARYEVTAAYYLDQIRRARDTAPFTDTVGLVASTLSNGESLIPIEQCVSTPFQCIAERVGLAATTWALCADQRFNPFLRVPARSDFNADARPDLLWANTQTGDAVSWYMNGTQWQNTWDYLGRSVPTQWKLVGAADFTGDGQPDLVWQNQATGDVSCWFMDGYQWTGSYAFLATGIPLDWKIVSMADFTGDGQPDLLWYNEVTGDAVIWLMNGTQWTGAWNYVARNIPLQWRIVCAGDFTGDGQADIVWQNQETGDVSCWQMNGAQWEGSYTLVAPGVPLDWKIVGAADYTGLGWTDLLWHNRRTGDVVIWQMSAAQWTGIWNYVAQSVPLDWRIAGPR